tara:strand:+ start:554 stop:1309 length:756 start_codon:yes stop_codon:yes gene_type:complete
MSNFVTKKQISNYKYTYIGIGDGFGAQYQQLITAYVVCSIHNEKFVYTSRNKMEHNYDNNPGFLKQIEDLMNIKNNIENNINNQAKIVQYTILRNWFEKNIDMACDSKYFKQIKSYFWQNKERNVFKNDKINISVHIRRPNSDDTQWHCREIIPHSYYLNIMSVIREKYKNKHLLFHIYSQGGLEDFKIYENIDVTLHINEQLSKTFIELVAADILVTSPSSFSYVAALLSDGEVYYKKFWHNPRKEWIVC